MVIGVSQGNFSAFQDQGNSRQLPVDRQQSAAPALTQASQFTQNEQNRALTVRPTPAPGSNNETTRAPDSKDDRNRNPNPTSTNPDLQLTEAEQQQVQELRARDREVRAHEQAHLAAAGSLARGGPSFTTQRGPDGRQYAVGGEVSISTSGSSNDPEETIAQAQQVRRAALAPANPSAQDRAVAAQATIQEQQARAELTQQRAEEARESTSNDENETSSDTSIQQGATSTSEPGERTSRPESIYREIAAIPEQTDENTLSVFA